MAVKRMDNIGIVVDDLAATIDFFRELGLDLEGQATIEGEWAGRVTGLGDQRVEIAMMRTPDGHGRLELSRFLTPPTVADHRNAPVNALGYLRVMFAVDDIDETLERLRQRLVDVVHGEHDAEVAESVYWGVAVIRDRRRREEAGELEPAVAVRRAHHRNLDALIAQSSDTSSPFSFDRGPPFELEAELAKEINRPFEVID